GLVIQLEDTHLVAAGQLPQVVHERRLWREAGETAAVLELSDDGLPLEAEREQEVARDAVRFDAREVRAQLVNQFAVGGRVAANPRRLRLRAVLTAALGEKDVVRGGGAREVQAVPFDHPFLELG